MSEDIIHRLTAALQGDYRIDREIGRGGMAIVYLAEDLRHHRQVAIKVLQPVVAETVGTERFLREVEVVAQLQHPHILTLIDSGDADGLPYYVMPYVAGESLRQRLESGPLTVEEATRIALEIADALTYAHAQGVIHRDVKPANVLLSEGHAVVADFGIAGALEYAATSRLTQTGASLGSPAYMSPEQVSGESDIDQRSDIYSLGCVLFEMLTGRSPFSHTSLQALYSRKLLGEAPSLHDLNPEIPSGVQGVIEKAMSRDRDSRYRSSSDLGTALRVATDAVGGLSPQRLARRRMIVGAAGAAALATLLVLGMALRRARAESRLAAWAGQQLAEIQRLSDQGLWASALDLAHELEAAVPDDSALSQIRTRFAYAVPIRSEPTGAEVHRLRIGSPEGVWERLGTTPLDAVWFAYGESYRVRIEARGRSPVEVQENVFWTDTNFPPWNPVRLDAPEDVPEGMVRVPGFAWSVDDDTIHADDYFIDRDEVTNRAYQAFIDAGGYEDPSYWVEPFEDEDGSAVSWDEAMARFVDLTGRPGPATWRLSTYPDGQDDHPVGGVSWYEAAAFARFTGKELPTIAHWRLAMRNWRVAVGATAPASNLGGEGPRPVGEGGAIGTYGQFDQIGNVREWCWNRAGSGRATRGGAWNDPPFMTGHVLPKSPWDRDPTNGFRLARTSDPDSVLARLREPVSATYRRDYRDEQPVPEAEYQVFRRFYAYDPLPLRANVEAVDSFPHWVREAVSFDLPYGERGGVYLYLPYEVSRPLQTIVYWAGSGVTRIQSVDDEFLESFDFVMRAGRAVVQPIWEGAFQRDDSTFSITDSSARRAGGTVYRDFMVHWFQDLARTLDYVETREDLDSDRIGYLGHSWGGQTAPIVLALEPRIKTAVLNVGGLAGTLTSTLPESDPLNFAPHVTTPVLMLNGEFDPVFPLETDQIPLYELWGTAPEDKEHVVFEASHYIPRDAYFRESLKWFDRYLGAPGR